MSNKEKLRQPYMDAAWFAGLMDEVRRSSKTAVAKKLGVNRTTISCVCNGSGEYGRGHASTKNIELAYRRAFEQLTCPHSQGQVGVSHCRETALRAAPTHNPLQMMQWQACQQCQYKPVAVIAAPVVVKPLQKIGMVTPVKYEMYGAVARLTEPTTQQAGIIDTRTLPLPEVGAPQIEKDSL